MSNTDHWQDWNRTATCLQSIEENAQWISHYCNSIKAHAALLEYAIKLLPDRPEWETKARDELTRSAEVLQLTLALCRSAMEAYDIKPVTEQLSAAE